MRKYIAQCNKNFEISTLKNLHRTKLGFLAGCLLYQCDTIHFTGDRTARIIEKPRVIEVETLDDGTVQSVPPVTTPRRGSHVRTKIQNGVT